MDDQHNTTICWNASRWPLILLAKFIPSPVWFGCVFLAACSKNSCSSTAWTTHFSPRQKRKQSTSWGKQQQQRMSEADPCGEESISSVGCLRNHFVQIKVSARAPYQSKCRREVAPWPHPVAKDSVQPQPCVGVALGSTEPCQTQAKALSSDLRIATTAPHMKSKQKKRSQKPQPQKSEEGRQNKRHHQTSGSLGNFPSWGHHKGAGPPTSDNHKTIIKQL